MPWQGEMQWALRWRDEMRMPLGPTWGEVWAFDGIHHRAIPRTIEDQIYGSPMQHGLAVEHEGARFAVAHLSIAGGAFSHDVPIGYQLQRGGWKRGGYRIVTVALVPEQLVNFSA